MIHQLFIPSYELSCKFDHKINVHENCEIFAGTDLQEKELIFAWFLNHANLHLLAFIGIHLTRVEENIQVFLFMF